MESATETFSKHKLPDSDTKRNRIRTNCINRAKSRETVQRPLPTAVSSNSSSVSDFENVNNGINDLDLSTNDLEISFQDLNEFDDTLTPEQRKKTPKKKKPTKKSKTKKLKEQADARKKNLFNISFNGDIDALKEVLDTELKDIEDSDSILQIKESFFNQIVDESSNTILHVVALNEHYDMLHFLLQNNANPCAKNKNQQTAYTCTQSKEIREILKMFAKENPDKYNYNKVSFSMNLIGSPIFVDFFGLNLITVYRNLTALITVFGFAIVLPATL